MLLHGATGDLPRYVRLKCDLLRISMTRRESKRAKPVDVCGKLQISPDI
jgi:hypothetical protein